MAQKVCKDCQAEKPETEFYVEPRNVGGRLHRCKACMLAQQKLYYQQHKEQIRVRQRVYRSQESVRLARKLRKIERESA